jgi:GNAT superfamily N-acetyltransferase
MIRSYAGKIDADALRECVIELQEFERNMDPRMPAGEDIADEYIVEMLNRCESCAGDVLVAEINGELAGYVTILNHVQSDDLDDGDMEFGLVADLLVRRSYRGTGLGGELMRAAEDFARNGGVTWLRVSVMAANRGARQLYDSLGFSEIYVELEKPLAEPRIESSNQAS